MWEIEPKFHVVLGGNTYIDQPNLISFLGEPLFTLKRRENDGRLGIDFDIFDKEGKRVATIRNGNCVEGDENNYDITREAEHYSVKEKSTGRSICDIRRNTADGELEISVDMFTPNGFHLLATPTQTNLGGMTVKGCTFRGNKGAGIALK